MVEEAEFLVVGAGPAGATAAREAARAGIEPWCSKRTRSSAQSASARRDCVRVFAARSICRDELIHCDTPRLALFDQPGREFEMFFGPGHTTTREELDGEIARLAVHEGAVRSAPSRFAFVRTRRGAIGGRVCRFAFGRTAAATRAQRVFRAGSDGALRSRVLRPALERRLDDDAAISHLSGSSGGTRGVSHAGASLLFGCPTGAKSSPGCFPSAIIWPSDWVWSANSTGSDYAKSSTPSRARTRDRLYANANVKRIKEEGHLLYGGWPRAQYAAGSCDGWRHCCRSGGRDQRRRHLRSSDERAPCRRRRSRTDRNAPVAPPQRYAQRLRGRFMRRLEHRVRLMRLSQARPARLRLAVRQLAGSPRLPTHFKRRTRTDAIRPAHACSQRRDFATRASFVVDGERV